MEPAEHAATLIKRLNDPAQAQYANATSQQLQDLQLSANAWSIADALLSTEDPVFQFYGALTFQIKINRDASSLSDDDRRQLLDRISRMLIICINNDSPARVSDKLCSVLGSLLIHAPYIWQDPLGEVLLRFLGASNSDAHAVDHVPDLSIKQFKALLKLALILPEDLGALQGNTPELLAIEEALKRSTPVFHRLVMRGISSADQSAQTYGDSLKVYNAWLSYGCSRWQKDAETSALYQQLADTVIRGLYSSNLARALSAADALSTAMTNDPFLINQARLGTLWTAVEHLLQSSSDCSNEERLPLIKLVTAWGKLMLEDIFECPATPQFQTFFQALTSQLFAVDWAEDGCEMLAVIVEFWVGFADELTTQLSNDWDSVAKTDMVVLFDPIIQAFFDALDRKDDRTMAEADPDYVEDWQRVRQDFADFMIMLMETDLIPVYEKCADQLEQAIEQRNWFRVESVLQILTEMANDWTGSSLSERGLRRIFKSELFKHLLEPNLIATLNSRMQRIIVRFIDNYSFFFKQEPTQIPAMVSLLMQLLERHVGILQPLADLSAKCMSSICSECRTELVAMLRELLDFCGRTLSAKGLSAYQKEKIYSGIAYVIEALPENSSKVAALQLIIGRLHQDSQFARDVISSGQREAGEQLIVTAFQCLAGVGKALNDTRRPIRLDDDEESPDQNSALQNPWATPEGDAVSKSILTILQNITLVPESGEAWEGICSILRVGLTETSPGPFVFPPTLISEFLSSMTPSTPRLEALLTTACSFLSAASRSTVERVPSEVNAVFTSVSKVILSLESPTSDPALAQLCVDFLERLLTRYSDVLFGSAELSPLVTFCLSALVSDAPMLKRTTASFVAALLELPQQLVRNEIASPAPGLPEFATNIINSLLPHVASALAHQLGGMAQRSELDAISKILRAFIMTGPRAKVTFEEAFSGNAFPSSARATEQQKRVFLNRVSMLRGGRGTTDVVKLFWAECKGTVGRF